MSTDGQVAGRAPIYARLLRLRRIKITGLMSFLLLECTVAVAILLALAELVSWWAVPLLPILVAVMVKVNDMVGGPAKEPIAVGAAGARASRVPPQRDEASTPFFDEPLPDEPAYDDLPDGEPAPVERERVEVRTGGWTVDRPTEEIMLPTAPAGRPRQRQSAWTERTAMEHAATTEFQMITDDARPEHAGAHGYAQEYSGAARAVNEAYAAYESPDESSDGRPAAHGARSSREVYETHEFPGVRDTADGYGREVYETHEFPSVRDTADAYGRAYDGQAYGAQPAQRYDDRGGAGYGAHGYAASPEYAEHAPARGYAAHGYSAREDADPRYASGEHEVHGYAANEPAAYATGDHAGHASGEYATHDYDSREHRHAASDNAYEAEAAYGYPDREYGGNQRVAAYEQAGRDTSNSGRHAAIRPAAQRSGEHAAVTSGSQRSGEHAAVTPAAQRYGEHTAMTSGAQRYGEHAARAEPVWPAEAAAAGNSWQTAETVPAVPVVPAAHSDREVTYADREAVHAAQEAAHSDREATYAVREATYAVRDSAHAVRDSAYADWEATYADREATHAVQEAAHADREATYTVRDSAYADRDSAHAVRDSAHAVRDSAHAVREAGAHAVPADAAVPTTQASAFPAQAAPVARAMSMGSLAAAGSALTARRRTGGDASQRSADAAPRTTTPGQGPDDRAQQPARQGSHAASYWSRVAAGQGPGTPTARPEGGIPPNLPGSAAPRRAQLFGAAVRRSMAAQAQQIGMNALGGTTRGASTRRPRESGSDTGRHSRSEGNATGRPGIRFNDRGFGRLRDA